MWEVPIVVVFGFMAIVSVGASVTGQALNCARQWAASIRPRTCTSGPMCAPVVNG